MAKMLLTVYVVNAIAVFSVFGLMAVKVNEAIASFWTLFGYFRYYGAAYNHLEWEMRLRRAQKLAIALCTFASLITGVASWHHGLLTGLLSAMQLALAALITYKFLRTT